MNTKEKFESRQEAYDAARHIDDTICDLLDKYPPEISKDFWWIFIRTVKSGLNIIEESVLPARELYRNTCPNCGKENSLTDEMVRRGYNCDACRR